MNTLVDEYRRIRVRVRGAVQGVGFRPHTRLLALRHHVTGWVLNDGEGVLIEAEGRSPEDFIEALVQSPPPLARIDAVEVEPMPVGDTADGFEIHQSEHGAVTTSIVPDAAVCPECLEDMFNPHDRRFLYPFINCTHCGPRFTITERLPYDRPNTSMAPFRMCPTCAQEYADQDDRRYHAQPTACPACGPSLSHDVADIVSCIRAGKIIALKGIGGFHLVCDAHDADAVDRLRERKHRDAKPFAIMAANLASLKQFAELDDASQRLISSVQAPIVLTRRKERSNLADTIAPGLSELGVILPYAPLHYLLFHNAVGSPPGVEWLTWRNDLVLVKTSANPGGEPLVINDDEAHNRLDDIADMVVTHDREILIRADDSVMRIVDGAPAFIRRARGFTPAPIKLPKAQPSVLAVGAHLKSTICLTRGDEAYISQHIGDLDNPSTYQFLQETVEHLKNLLEVDPDIIACDMHPDFLSTRYAESLDRPLIRVQHHHAHIAAIAAEYRIEGPLLGLSLDGHGYGLNKEAWGGELILHDDSAFQRVGHISALQLPGGDAAARQPWRIAAGALSSLGRGDEIEQRFSSMPQAPAVAQLLARGCAATTTSCGRLFDAAAGLLGVSSISQFEAQPAMLLEALVDNPVSDPSLWRITNDVLDFSALLNRLADLHSDNLSDRVFGANLFHGVLIEAFSDFAKWKAAQFGVDNVALSGGCMLNRVLAEGLIRDLNASGLNALYPRRVPPGDGAVSLGQALVAGRPDNN